jgi:uncharacterized protein (TIGR00369 family)
VELLGIRLLRSAEGEGVAELDADLRHHNAMGAVHGGVLCDLADVAIGAAVVSILDAGETFATVSLYIDFLHGISSARLTARSRIVKRGSAVIFCECSIEDDAGRQVASVRSTCLLRRTNR